MNTPNNENVTLESLGVIGVCSIALWSSRHTSVLLPAYLMSKYSDISKFICNVHFLVICRSARNAPMNDYSTANMANPVVDYYKKHLPVRNKIRRYSPATILEIATYVLRTKADEGLGNKPTYLPWIIMLIIRWIYQYGDIASRREITEAEFNGLNNDVYTPRI